jgi:hypothetical protein
MQIGDRTTIAGIVLSAAIALGTVALPPDFWAAHEGLRALVLVACGIIIVVGVLYLCYLHINWKGKMLYPILMMVAGGALFFAGAIWYGIETQKRSANSVTSSTVEASTPSTTQKPWKHELADLYNSDFNLLSLQRELTLTVLDKASNVEQATIIVRFRIYQDFDSNTEFVSTFIPVSHNVKTDENIYNIIQALRDQILVQYDDLKKSVGTGSSRPGVPYSEGKDLKFSGRVLIYTMQSFTVIQVGELASLYQEAGMSLQIRGYDYWWANKDR